MNFVTLHQGESLQNAIDALPSGACTIRLMKGVYREKVRVTKDDLTILGEGKDTVLVYGDAANHIHQDGTPFVTFRTPTLTILGDGVTLKNLCVKNDAGSGKEVGQAVAMSVYGDRFLAEHCFFEARQDTLFLGPLPVDLTKRYAGFLPEEELHTRPLTHRFHACTIEGDVDFIFGSATALFQDCEIVCLGDGYLGAPSTYETSPLGLCFVNCLIRCVNQDARPYLARPWRNHGMALFLDCAYQGTFHPERFHPWEKPFHRLYETPPVESPLSSPVPDDLLGELKRLMNQ